MNHQIIPLFRPHTGIDGRPLRQYDAGHLQLPEPFREPLGGCNIELKLLQRLLNRVVPQRFLLRKRGGDALINGINDLLHLFDGNGAEDHSLDILPDPSRRAKAVVRGNIMRNTNFFIGNWWIFIFLNDKTGPIFSKFGVYDGYRPLSAPHFRSG